MTIGVPSAILAAVVSLTIGIAILFRRPRRRLYGYFAGFAFALTLWHTSSVASRLTEEPLSRPQGLAAILIAPTAWLFFRELLRLDRSLVRLALRVVIGVGLLLLVLALLPFWPWNIGLQLSIIAYVGAALALVLRAIYRRTKETAAEHDTRRLRFLFYGGGAAVLLACGEFIPGTGAPAAVGHVAVTIFAYFMYQSIISRRLIDTGDLLGKGAVLALLTLVLSTVYGLLVRWVGADQPGLWLFNTLVASFVILIIYDQVRPWVEQATAKLFFRERYHLRQAAQQLQRQLRTVISLDHMCTRTLDSLHATGQASNVALFLWRESARSYVLAGFRGAPPPDALQTAALLQDLEREQRPIHVAQLRDRRDELAGPLDADGSATRGREIRRLQDSLADMRSLHASLMLPLRAAERVVGILTLGQEGRAPPYSSQDITYLLAVADACAVVLENSAEVERLKQRDRLAAIGEMATGMAHEIRNPLGAIKGAAQCLDPATLPKESLEFVDVIIEEVDRLNGVVAQFLEYARPYRGNPRPTPVNQVITRTLKLLDPQTSSSSPVPRNVLMQCDLAHELPDVSIDPEQLRQVLLNLVLNAVQAMPHGGKVMVSTSIRRFESGVRGVHQAERDADHVLEKNEVSENMADNDTSHEDHTPQELAHYSDGSAMDQGSSRVLIEVRDEGVGIASGDLSRIFVPFFTTKEKGTGLGLAICQRIIENTEGRLEVRSSEGKGSIFTLSLPVLSQGARETLVSEKH